MTTPLAPGSADLGPGPLAYSGPGSPAPGRRTRSDAIANQERVLAAAVTAILREGRQVPMSSIADEAGVGVGTLYRHYPTREALLVALTERSFRLVHALVVEAERRSGPAIEALNWFLEGTLGHRDQLVLPLHGGPADLNRTSQDVRAEVHAAIERILQRGRGDGTVRADVVALDVVVFGALLAQPLSGGQAWLRNLRRQKQLFLAGLAPGPPQLEEP